MDRFQVPRDATHYNTILTGLAHGSRFQEITKYFTDMRARNIEPSPWSYAALITAFGKARAPEKAMEIFRLARAANQLTSALATQVLSLVLKEGPKAGASEILSVMREMYA